MTEIFLQFQVRAGDGNLPTDEAAHHARDEEQLQGRRHSSVFAAKKDKSLFGQFKVKIVHCRSSLLWIGERKMGR